MSLGIFYRLLFSLMLLFLVSTGFMAYTLINEAKKSSDESLLHQASSMSQSLAEGSLDALAVSDYELIERWLKASHSIDHFAYAYLSKSDGLIISHTELELVARHTDSLGELDSTVVRDTEYHNRPVREVVHGAYLGEKHMANAHIGYYTDKSSLYSDQTISRLVTILVVSLIILSISTFFILRWVLHPIESLADVMHEVSVKQDYSLRAKKHSNDEIGRLVSTFNNMLDLILRRDRELVDEKEHAEKSAEAAKVYAHEVEKSNADLEVQISERLRVEMKLQELNETLEHKVKQRTKKLEELNKKIAEVARSAGMAEVASGILHNVGNVLNSVNVSSKVIRDNVSNSALPNLARVLNMLEEHKDDLGDFISSDERGQQVPQFLQLLYEKLETEHSGLFCELDELDKNIDHIKNVIKTQQSYAGNYGVVESVQLKDLIEDSLKINLGNAESSVIEVIREFEELPVLQLDKHKILQVLINFISNAKHALLDSDNKVKKLIIRLSKPSTNVEIEVEDTGLGIEAEDMPHLFEYGFKKRTEGHGFGLHNSALLANELGGKVMVDSAGPGKGACFKLILPIDGHGGEAADIT